MNGIRNSLVTALVVVALLVTFVVVFDTIANPVDHESLDARLQRIERMMESVCLATPDCQVDGP